MVFKVISFFLIGMMVLAMFGRLRVPRLPKITARKCPRCGRPRIGSSPCDCEKKG